MKVFLRNRQTRLYCAAPNGWTVASTEAVAFPDIQIATRFALDQNLPEAEIAVRSDLLDQEVVMPLLPECYFSRSELAA
jgi:hypothetical protein